jgi:hypothetical protein
VDICFFDLKNVKRKSLCSFVNFDMHVIFAWLNEIVKKQRVFGKMLIVCLNVQRQKNFYYIRLESGSYLFSDRPITF